MSKTNHAAQKAGRAGLWILFPPLGFLRSREYGRRRQAELIAKAIDSLPESAKPTKQPERYRPSKEEKAENRRRYRETGTLSTRKPAE